jgi:hypothetical protein
LRVKAHRARDSWQWDAPAALAGLSPVFIKPLRVACSFLIPAGFRWNCRCFLFVRAARAARSRRGKAAKGVHPMPNFSLTSLLLIPFALGEAFLIWALWQLFKQTRR